MTTKLSAFELLSMSITDTSILELSGGDAKSFLLSHDAYCNFNLPKYFDFKPLLDVLDTYLQQHDLRQVSSRPFEHDDVSYTVFANKDGSHSWRPLS